MKYAPVLIPTLCRSEHFIRLVESLKKNSWAQYTDLVVAVDYSPHKKYDDGRSKICSYLEKEDFSLFKSLKVIKRTRNYGAIDNGDMLVQEYFEKYDRLILLPDDIDVAPNFIEYMDKCLDKYEKDDDVFAVCGYTYPLNWNVSDGATCLLIQTNCAVWGIGYWKNKYYTALDDLSSGRVLGKYPEFIKIEGYKKMIDASFREYVEAACYRWCYGHQWLLNMSDIGLRAYLGVMDKYVVCPVVSKVRNYGFDGSGQYCEKIESNDTSVTSFDFLKQPIDNSAGFEVIEDTLGLHQANRDLLNVFDSRTDKQMRKSRRILWISKKMGVNMAKIYCILGLPMDFVIRAYNKYIRK